MSALYQRKHDTLTSRNIADSYMYAYQSIHGIKPECEYVEGRWFMVDGVRRDRHWLILEIERLRQEALAHALDADQSGSTSNIFRMIRRLSRL